MPYEPYKTPTRLTFLIYEHLKALGRWQTATQVGVACGCTRNAANGHLRLLADASMAEWHKETRPNKFRIAQDFRTINPALTATLDNLGDIYKSP